MTIRLSQGHVKDTRQSRSGLSDCLKDKVLSRKLDGTVKQNKVVKQTFKLFGCSLTSVACFLFISFSALKVYSFWLANSVWCCLRMCSSRSLCMAPRCLYSKSCVESWCRNNMLWAYSSWALRLSNSWKSKPKRAFNLLTWKTNEGLQKNISTKRGTNQLIWCI